MRSVEIKTNKLCLRRWKAEDIDPFANMCADPEVMKWIGSGVVRTREECLLAIENSEHFWEENGFGLFAVELRETQSLIGFSGFAVPSFLPEIMPSIEIAWRFVRDAWGHGYATEAATAALNFGLKERGLERVVSIYQVGNEASGRVMEKIGMSLYLETIDPSSGRPVKVYDIVEL